MSRTHIRPQPLRPVAAGLLALAVVVGGVFAHNAMAQNALGEPTDVRFEIINGTTLRGGSVERLTLEYVTQRPNLVLEVDAPDTTFTAEDVPILPTGEYLVTAWKDGVPYYFSRRGRDVAEGIQTIHVFDTTTELEGLTISGLTMVLKREESLLEVEIMLQVQNDARPQVTVVGNPGALTLDLPADIVDVAAEYHRGLDPTLVKVVNAGGACTLGVPLITGANRVRVTGTLPWQEGRDLVLGANLPVSAWSVMVSPEWMEIESFEMEGQDEGPGGYRRYKGSALEANRTLTMRLHSGENAASPAGDVFTQPAPSRPEAATEKKDGGGLPLPLILGGVVLVILLLLTTRKQG